MWFLLLAGEEIWCNSYLILLVPEKPFCSPQPQSLPFMVIGQIMTLLCSERKRRKSKILSKALKAILDVSLPCMSPVTYIPYLLAKRPIVFISLGETAFI